MARKLKGKKRKQKGLKHSRSQKAKRQTKRTRPKKQGPAGQKRADSRAPKQRKHAAAHQSDRDVQTGPDVPLTEQETAEPGDDEMIGSSEVGSEGHREDEV